MINMAWKDVTRRTLNSAWRKLWSEVVSERESEGFQPKVAVVEEIVYPIKSMDLEVDEGDVNKLIEEISDELTTE